MVVKLSVRPFTETTDPTALNSADVTTTTTLTSFSRRFCPQKVKYELSSKADASYLIMYFP